MNIQEIPIINYHKIIPSFDIGITTRHPKQFESDMKVLKESGFSTVTFNQVLNQQPVVEKPIIITFDDGYESVLEFALPVLDKYGFKGVIYLPTHYLGSNNDWDVQIGKIRFRHLNQTQIRGIAGGGHEIGSHGHRHQNLCALNPENLRFELSTSKHILEEITGQQILSVSYPFGRFDPDVLNAAIDTGYRFGLAAVHFTTLSGSNADMALRRFNIYRFDSVASFQTKVQMSFTGFTGIRDWLIQRGGYATTLLQKLKMGKNLPEIIKDTANG